MRFSCSIFAKSKTKTKKRNKLGGKPSKIMLAQLPENGKRMEGGDMELQGKIAPASI